MASLDKSYVLKARDEFLKIANKKSLTDEEIWILIQATAQYLGVVQAHKTLRGIIAAPANSGNSGYFEELEHFNRFSWDPEKPSPTLFSFESALFYASRIIQAVGEGQDPMDIERQVLGKAKGRDITAYKQMIGDLESGLSEAIEYRTTKSREPEDLILHVGDNRTGLPEGLSVLVYAGSLIDCDRGAYYSTGSPLKAKVVQRYEAGIITHNVHATVIEILDARDTKSGGHENVIDGLMIDLKANPKAPHDIIKFLVRDEVDRFMYRGGAFSRKFGTGVCLESYMIPAADIQRPA